MCVTSFQEQFDQYTDTCQDDYDRALQKVDVLVMPTLPSPPCRLFEDPQAHGPLERLSRNVGLVGNTAPYNSTFRLS